MLLLIEIDVLEREQIKLKTIAFTIFHRCATPSLGSPKLLIISSSK